MKKGALLFVLLSLPLSGGCLLGPKYVRPTVSAPAVFRGEEAPADKAARSAGDEKWWEVYRDEALQKLIREALEKNHDLRIAAERILEMQARVGVARADQFPTVSGSGSYEATRFSKKDYSPVVGDPVKDHTSFSLGAAFELDFWGKMRRATEAARANLLATRAAADTVRLTLVASVASAYFQLCELDVELAIARRTLQSRKESYSLVKDRLEGGVASRLDLDQAQVLVSTAAAAIPDAERQIALTEDSLCLLLARNPGPIRRDPGLLNDRRLLNVPAGLPSSLLERRPDIRAAEQQLIAANANIGVAKAAYFPSISLTGSAGTLSKDCADLFTRPSWNWAFSPAINLPIFNAGKIRSGVRVSESLKRQAVAAYEKAVLTGFKEVADALATMDRLKVYVREQETLVATLKDQSELSRIRYEGGVTSYMEVLDSERQYFEAENNLAASYLYELQAQVDLYRALGGGWQQ